MAYNKKNKLKRMIEVQKLFKEHYKPGMSIEFIYRNHIYPAFKISRTTFYTWNNTPAEKLLKELENGEKEANTMKQLSLGLS